MPRQHHLGDIVDRARTGDNAAAPPAAGPGKHTRVDAYAQRWPGAVQARGNVTGDSDAMHAAAERGVQGAATALPHADSISRAFGKHDISQVQAFVGGPAKEATTAMGAGAYAMGNQVAFAEAPDLHTAAHEAAHVVQQRAGVQLKGGVGQAGDPYERHADAVADRVVAGQSAEDLLDAYAGGGATRAVQRQDGGDDATLLANQAKLKTTDDEIPALEGALLATRQEAVKRGLLSQASYNAGLALSRSMTLLQPAVAASGAVDPALQEQAALAAQQLFASLQSETGNEQNFHVMAIPGDTGGSVTTHNPYTDELRVTTYVFLSTSEVTASWLENLPGQIRQGNWADAFRGYRQILNGLDLWIADQLRKAGKGTPDEALGNAQQAHAQLLTGLEQIAGKHAARLPAVFHPDPQSVADDRAAGRPASDAYPMNVYTWKEDGKTHIYDLTRSEPIEQPIDGEPTAAAMATFFEGVARYPKGQVRYQLPDGSTGVAPTSGDKRWYEWIGIAGLVIAGLGLAALTAGASVPATVLFAAGALAGGVSAAGHLVESTQLGTATAGSVVLDVAQIVSAFASFGALSITVRAGSAAAAITNSRWVVPLLTTAATADVVQLVALTDVTVGELDKIQKGSGTPEDKQRAMTVLLTQLIVTGGLTALSVQGARNARAMLNQSLEIVEEGGVEVLRVVGDETPVVPPSSTSARVTEPVPGLYDAVDPDFTPAGWDFLDSPPHPHPKHPEWVQIRTEVTAPDGSYGLIERSYDATTKTLVMENAFLDKLPRWIEAGVPLGEKGTPTVTYLTLRQMKMLGVGFGETQVVKMSTIQNIEAVMQLEQMKRSGVPYEEGVARTHSVTYATTSIQQSGQTITSVTIDTSQARLWELSAMMDWYEMPEGQRQALFALYGLAPTDKVLVDYNIYLYLAPFTGQAGQ